RESAPCPTGSRPRTTLEMLAPLVGVLEQRRVDRHGKWPCAHPSSFSLSLLASRSWGVVGAMAERRPASPAREPGRVAARPGTTATRTPADGGQPVSKATAARVRHPSWRDGRDQPPHPATSVQPPVSVPPASAGGTFLRVLNGWPRVDGVQGRGPAIAGTAGP